MAIFPGAIMARAVGRACQFELTLSAAERTALEAMDASRTLPYSHVRRARVVLASAAGA
jgi:hypothetical protein